MRNPKKSAILALLLLVLGALFLYGEDESRYSLGAILNEEAYAALPRKAPLATRAYEGMPAAYSLKLYSPLPGDQADYGTCVAWAAAYAARTTLESVALDRRNQVETTRNAFSPVYIYRSIQPDDPECQRGAQISWALNLMKDTGAVKMLDMERTLDFPSVDISQYRKSKKYPIADYVTLFNREEKNKPGLITRAVKKSLVEGKPVIIGMNTPNSFLEAETIWQPSENPESFYGGHALCVIGYDDEKNGGAFEVINSWGRKWGNGGFMWIPYRTFVDFVMEGYEMIENLATYSDTVKFAGFARIEILDGPDSRPAALEYTEEGFYKTTELLRGGTEFRFIAGSSESAYMYAFAATQEPPAAGGGFYSPVQLFPQAGISPLLNYRDSTVSLPGENRSLVLDDSPGMEYLVILYAKQALDMRGVMRRFEAARGNVQERLAAAVGSYLLPVGRAGGASFALETADSRSVASLVLAIDHR
ncbi:MAG: C1 family peptidase [Treponema sp.]|jgi:hypothetical protein|nr:C1 family peptidase [Treponema sp.]